MREQLDSLLAQTVTGFGVLVSDDGSTDDTKAILAEYDHAWPGRFRILPGVEGRLGPLGNFGRLVEAADADYIFLCDQDDIWLPDKMAVALDAIRALEARHGVTTPCLVHTDLTVVDRHCDVLGESFFGYVGIDPQLDSLASLLTGNIATGCTFVFNRALRDRAVPFPVAALMHDHWLALIASAVGVIDCVRQSSILYRQHGGNCLGARPAKSSTFLRTVSETFTGHQSLGVMQQYVQTAETLSLRVGGELDPGRRAMLAAFAGLTRRSPLRRLLTLARHRIYKRGRFKASIGLYVLAFRLSRDPASARDAVRGR